MQQAGVAVGIGPAGTDCMRACAMCHARNRVPTCRARTSPAGPAACHPCHAAARAATCASPPAQSVGNNGAGGAGASHLCVLVCWCARAHAVMRRARARATRVGSCRGCGRESTCGTGTVAAHLQDALGGEVERAARLAVCVDPVAQLLARRVLARLQLRTSQARQAGAGRLAASASEEAAAARALQLCVHAGTAKRGLGPRAGDLCKRAATHSAPRPPRVAPLRTSLPAQAMSTQYSPTHSASLPTVALMYSSTKRAP